MRAERFNFDSKRNARLSVQGADGLKTVQAYAAEHGFQLHSAPDEVYAVLGVKPVLSKWVPSSQTTDW